MNALKQFLQAKATLLEKKEKLDKKNLKKRPFITMNKAIKESRDYEALELALESITVLESLEKYFSVSKVKKIGEDNEYYSISLKGINDITDIPSLEVQVLKHWKDKYTEKYAEENIKPAEEQSIITDDRGEEANEI